jgi:hypothetical protein
MKKFENALLLFKINTNNDIVKCWYVFWIGWFTFKVVKNTFDLKEVSLKIVVEFYKDLTNDYQKKYRL